MKLAYREYGSGQPLIILHGLFGQSDNWNTLARQFGEQELHVFTVDQRNHGLSPHSEEWTYEAMAGDLKEFIEEHQLQDPVLLGHSMGAKTALYFELLFPGQAYKLIIADMAARAYPPHHASILQALNSINFKEIKSRKEAENVLSQYIDDFGTRQFLLKNIYWKDSSNQEMAWRFNLDVITEKYNQIGAPVPVFKSHVPALIVKGARSGYVNEQDLEDFSQRFRTCEVKTIAGAGHWVHAEKPKEFFDACLDFIKAPVL